jgi:hypothetical protein
LNIRPATRIFLALLAIAIAVWVIAFGIGIAASIIEYLGYSATSTGAH